METSSESEEVKRSQMGDTSASSGVVMEVDVEVACEGIEEAEAVAEVKDESALGSWLSGVIVIRSVSQLSSGLRLRSRSPRPSMAAVRASSEVRPERLDPLPAGFVGREACEADASTSSLVESLDGCVSGSRDEEIGLRTRFIRDEMSRSTFEEPESGSPNLYAGANLDE